MRSLLRVTVLPLAALGILSTLQSCSTFQPPVASPANKQLRYHERIGISGRFSVSYQQEGKPSTAQGRFQWQQRSDEVDIDLLSPLGQTLARIRVTPRIAVLERPGQPTQSASNASELTEQLLGWAIPADGLRYWLQGFTAVGSEHMAASSTHTNGFHAGDWTIRFVSWQGQPGDHHPKRIDLSRLSPTTGRLGLRLVIDGWEPQ